MEALRADSTILTNTISQRGLQSKSAGCIRNRPGQFRENGAQSTRNTGFGALRTPWEQLFVASDQELFVGFATGQASYAGGLLEGGFAVDALRFHYFFNVAGQRDGIERIGDICGVNCLAVGRADQ